MNSINVKKIEIIVKDLLSEFDKESSKLQSEYDDNVVRILEIEENIHNYKENEDVESLKDMVKQVNSTEVPNEDVLSDNVYHYNANTGLLEIAY